MLSTVFHSLNPIVRLFSQLKFAVEFGFLPPPLGTDLIGYETLIRYIKSKKLLEIPGDLVEVGVFMGGGTYKLSKYMDRMQCGKTLYAIDIFDISVDLTRNSAGEAMSNLYKVVMKGKSQWDIFHSITKNCDNIVLIKGDSKYADIPSETICFAFIDGNHAADYVLSDFYLVWTKLSHGGVVAFDDYGHDLPIVTMTVNELIKKHDLEISNYTKIGKIMFIEKK